jgi:hypothetical protein
VDNDLDGLVDAEDDGCRAPGDTTERADCSDGIDNDHDGLDDFPADPGCLGPDAPVEDADGLLACGLLGPEPLLLLGGAWWARRRRVETRR